MAISRPSLDRQPDREPRAAVPPASNTPAFDLEAYVARSRAVDLSAIPWDEIPRHPLSAETIRTLRYMQDIESHTIIYLRSLLATRAINELTTLTGYRRLVEIARHPVLTDLLERIIIDESRHFFFYYRQAEIRLQRPIVARTARFLVDRFWAPVGSGVQPREELGFMARYLFSGAEGRAAARKVDDTIRRLPGFASVQLVEAWMDTNVTDRPGVSGTQPGARLGTPYGGHHGHGYH